MSHRDPLISDFPPLLLTYRIQACHLSTFVVCLYGGHFSDISPRPILIIHGEQDTIVNPRDAVQLYEAAKEPKELWLAPDAEHCGAYFADRKAYVAKVIDFFDLHLRKARLRLRLVGSS